MKKVLIITLSIISILIVAFVLWAVVPYTVMDEAVYALNSNDEVLVVNHEDIAFRPVDKEYTKGLIIYPGTRVDSESYSPLAQRIAEEGYLVVLANMPLDLSVLNINRATKIIEANPEIDSWAIAGHSMGGAMAGFYAEKNLDKIDTLIMLGSYVSKNTNLSNTDLTVLSLFGTFDYVSSIEEVLAVKPNFPSDAIFYEIIGGNHAGFGYYGEQKGDGIATITRDEQNDIIAEQIINIFENVEN